MKATSKRKADDDDGKDAGKRKKPKSRKQESSSDSSSEDDSDEDSGPTTNKIGMFAAPNEPLTDHVDSKLRKKVIKGEYVELSKLFRKDAAQTTTQVFSLENGSLQLKDNEKKISSFGMWLDCFLVFMTIRGKKYPEEMLGMLKHVETVKRLSYQGFDGTAYDIRFRHMKATYGSLPWGQYMPEIISIPAKQGTSKPNNFGGKGFCRFFNDGFCTRRERCNYRHVCSKCKSPSHGAKQCRQ